MTARNGAGDGADEAGRDRGSEAGPPPDHAAQAREICLRLLTARARTRAELAKALARRGVPADVAERVLDRYTEVGLIDDTAVARATVEGQLARGLARRALAAKLRQRGVGDEEIGQALDAVPAGTELAAARAVAQRAVRSSAGQPPEVRARRLAGRLARRGYPPWMVRQVVDESVRDVPWDGADDLG